MRLKLSCSLVAVLFLFTSVKGQFAVPAELTLGEARRLMLRHNPILKSVAARVDMEEADVISAGQRPNPELTLSSEGLNFRSESRPFLDDQEISMSLRYRIETAQKREKRTRLERLEADIGEIGVTEATRHLLFELNRTYFQLVLAQEDLTLGRTLLDGFQTILSLNQVRYEKGEISGGELRRVEAEQYRFLEDIVAAEVELENAQDHLLSLIGSERFDQTVTAIDPLKSTMPDLSPADLREAALASRSDLKMAHADLLHSDAEMELQEALSAPDIIPFVGYRRDFGSNGLVAGFQLPLPFFDRNEGEIERSAAERRERQWQLRQTQIVVLREVQVAFNRLLGHQRRVELLESEYLEKSLQARDIAESAYRLGGISLVEFLDAQRIYRETARLFNQALYDLRVSQARLELVVGREL